jgi:hypothetical protein
MWTIRVGPEKGSGEIAQDILPRISRANDHRVAGIYVQALAMPFTVNTMPEAL